MGEAETALKLLTTDDLSEAATAAKILTALNNKRKTTVATMVRAAQKQAEKKNNTRQVWVFGSREWKPSLVGLVAHRLADTHDKTVFVWGQEGAGERTAVKGSCRSAKCDVFSLMKNTPDMFTESGGHKRAGGFTVQPGAEVQLEEALNAAMTGVQEEENERNIVDGECTASEVPSIYELHKKFMPFGMENEAICIAIPECRISKKVVFGKNKEHVRCTITDGTGYVDGIAFFAKNNTNSVTEHSGVMRAVIGEVETDAFRNKVQIRIIRCIPAGDEYG